jgi:uncharacterized protein (DUF885 family)
VRSASNGHDSLYRLAHEYWERRMADEPLFATVLGDRRFDDKLPDVTPEKRALREREYSTIVRRCTEIASQDLSEADRLTRIALLVDAQSVIDYSSCSLEEWTVDPLQGPQVEFVNAASFQPVRSPEEGRAMVSRWTAMGGYFDDHVENLRRGLMEGKAAVRVCVDKVIEEVEEILSKEESGSGFLRPLGVSHPEWSEGERNEFRRRLTAAVSESIRPALRRYLAFLKMELAPKARPQERPGIVSIPGGKEAYPRLVKVHTSLGIPPDELQAIGMREVGKIDGEMERLGEQVFGTRERKEILRKLRTDPTLYFSSRDEVAEKARSALSKARAAISRWFGRLPKADCEVVVMGEHEEKHSTIAYYRQPAADGSRPGQYFINTSDPTTRPRYEAEALAYHESIPGHHLQIAIAQELEGIPEFRRNSGVTAFVEGWGLYSERLSDEMGLYSSDLDRMGVLSYDAWRACRLVVDTGMHAMGWTRDQAIDFMMDNTALAKNNIVNEVDRYITWPGQALAYKVGQLELVRLRQQAEDHMGGRFDIKTFHDAVLGGGALPLEALRQAAERYIQRE